MMGGARHHRIPQAPRAREPQVSACKQSHFIFQTARHCKPCIGCLDRAERDQWRFLRSTRTYESIKVSIKCAYAQAIETPEQNSTAGGTTPAVFSVMS
jgi:hypothetical protein